MTALTANCPACGGPITWKTGSSMVLVCEYCGSVVARGDRTVESIGKVADLVETGSPLQLGLSGRYGGIGFELVGRAQLQHEAGGVWDEWYAHFTNDNWGWLAEAQGRFYLTFAQKQTSAELPPYDALVVGQPVVLPGSLEFVVAEKAMARAVSGRGEMPYVLDAGASYHYADLSGPAGAFATLDYSQDPPLLFVGRQLTLDGLGIAASAAAGAGAGAAAAAPEREARQIKATELYCPECRGPLTLRAPDQSQRVTCPNCGGLLDVSGGRLAWLKALEPPKIPPLIALGSVGTLLQTKWTVLGFLERSVTADGVRYPWHEYLLYEPRAGFCWLTESDGHWSFVEAVAPGDVQPLGRNVRCHGKLFRVFQLGNAVVDYVMGEFYWRIEAGESVASTDYIAPPEMLSREESEGEINWSLGSYLEPAQVQRAFGLKKLPPPVGVAPHQPYRHGGLGKMWLGLLAAALLTRVALSVAFPHKDAFASRYDLAPLTGSDGSQVVFSEPFQLYGRRNIAVTLTAPVDQSWLYVEGDLINESTGLVQSFTSSVEYYHGHDSDGSWSEGDRAPRVLLRPLPAGTYTMRLECQWEHWNQPLAVDARVEQGVTNLTHLLVVLGVISLFPILGLLYRLRFEKRRWSQSDYAPVWAREQGDS